MTPEERFERLEISLHNIRDILAETAVTASRTEDGLSRTEAALARTEAGLSRTEAALARTEAGLARTEAGLARTEATLRRAIRLGVQEARAERQRRRGLEQLVGQIAAAQLVTEEKLQRFLESRAHHNGDSK